ncbi:hypothetical protein V5N11_008338 [Cardamine amara subsp. amara]|uniref:Retrotransposon Copia-like N-terminal domain-containing protein n=1 Tax=Cardamine amara subsp. amara TaxID=228776 RepID=A0ABD0ZXB9_CARAN
MENLKYFTLPVILKGNNYLLWSRTTKTALRSRGVWIHCLTAEEMLQGQAEGGATSGEAEGSSGGAKEGEVECPAQINSSKGDSKWIQEDQLVLAVLQSSLEPSILASYSYVGTAKELWDTLLGVYGNESNLSRIYEIKKALANLQQERKDILTKSDCINSRKVVAKWLVTTTKRLIVVVGNN